jgi:tetratricopeptide (TPR) repeat protein
LQHSAEFYLQVGELKKAEECLRSLLVLKVKDPEAERRARSLLPVVLAAVGDHARLQEALALLGLSSSEPVKMPAETPPDELRSRAVVLATIPGRSRARQAIEILKSLEGRKLLSAEDRFLLVQLYDRLGEKRVARSQLGLLLESDEKNPRYMAYQVRSLLREELIPEAAVWLEALEKIAPKAAITTELKVAVLKGQERTREVLDLVKERMATSDPASWLQAGALLENVGMVEAAGTYYRRYAAESKDTARMLVLARYLGRQGNSKEALRLCREAWKNCPAEAVAYAALDVVHSAAPEPNELAALKREITDVLKNSPQLTGLKVCLANLEDLIGNYESARSLYRSVLRVDAQNVVALNNLAWLQCLAEGNGEEALELANRTVKLLGPIPELLDTRALAYLATGAPDKALEDLEEAETSPLNRKTLGAIKFHRALAHAKKGDTRKARNAFEEAVKTGLTRKGLHPLEKAAWDALNQIR